MPSTLSSPETTTGKPISFGLSCWRWERRQYDAITRLAEHLGVTLCLRQRCHGLRRDIEGEVSGQKVDQFITEFARNC